MSHDQLPRQQRGEPVDPIDAAREDLIRRREAVGADQPLDYTPRDLNNNKASWMRKAAIGVTALVAAGGIVLGIKSNSGGNNSPEKRPVAAAPGHENHAAPERDPKKWTTDNAPTAWADKSGEPAEYAGVDAAAKGIEIRDSEYPTATDKMRRFLDLTNQLINYGHTPALEAQNAGYVSEDGELRGSDAVVNDFAAPAFRQGLTELSSSSGNTWTTMMMGLNVGYVAENYAESKKHPGAQQYRLLFTPDTSKAPGGIEVIENTEPGMQEAKLYYTYTDNAERAGVPAGSKLTGWDVLDVKWLSRDGVSKITNIEAQNDPVG